MNETQNRNYGPEIIRLISFLERRRRRFMNEGLKDYAVHGTMFMYIVTLDNFPGSSQDFLAEHLCIDKSNVARSAKRLEAEGYILREVSELDRRQYCMYLTEKGQQLLPIIRNLLSQWAEMAAEGLPEEQKRLASEILNVMHENVLPKVK